MVLYSIYYIISGSKYISLIYDPSVSPRTLLNSEVFFIPNILNYISIESINILWLATALLIPLILFRKLKFIAGLFILYLQSCFMVLAPLSVHIGTQTFLMLILFATIIPIPNKILDNERDDKIYTQPLIFLALWINFVGYYFYSGLTKIVTYGWYSGLLIPLMDTHPLMRQGIFLEIFKSTPFVVKKIVTWYIAFGELIAPLALISFWLRKKIWICIIIIQLGLLFFMNLSDVSVIMIIYSIILFDPDWISVKTSTKINVFYDGYCGLCHGFVRHVINIDNKNNIYFTTVQSVKEYKDNIDSIIVKSDKGDMYYKYNAVRFIYKNIGGIFTLMSYAMYIIPDPLGNFFYDIIAKNRYKIFGKKDNVCPVFSKDLEYKFIQ